jgi:two-component system sensor histidine kinase/response regulator
MKIENVNLLVVDDDELNRKMFSRLLKRKDYNVETANSGKEALELIENNSFDLILLDIVMPEINGIEILKIIREKYTMTQLPIIMVTARDEVEGIVSCLELGANDYVTKPINLAIVTARIEAQVSLKRTEAAQENLLIELQKLNYDKDKFFSIISHDLRTPLTPIIGASEFIIDCIDTMSKDEIKSFAEKINNSAENLAHLLEGLLQWSGVQNGRIEYDPTEISLFELVSENIELFTANAQKKGIELLNKVSEDAYIFADRNMITSVIRNLISNSIKFTGSGGTIEISEKDSDGFKEVSVTDTGMGMTKEDSQRLFRIDILHTTSGTEKEKGTGLGLILCKEFVEKNNGRIWVESESGHGSTFKFTVPLSQNNL